VAYGFVVAASNGGHRASDYPGASFASDRGLTLSYSVAKMYDTDLVAKALIRAYYGEPARYRYFTGCSNGGKNASVAASNFFDHYDGVIGAAGVWGHADDEVGGSDMPGLTAKWSQTVQVGALPAAKGAALAAKTVQTCDAMDGYSDGIVSNVQACPFAEVAESLRCAGPDDGTCLTDANLSQIRAHTSSLTLFGKIVGPAWSGTANLADVGAVSALASGFLSMAFRSAAPVDPLSFDVTTQFDVVKAVLDDVYSMSGDLDGLRKYLNKDKKLILYHGWNDFIVPTYSSINFTKALRAADRRASRNMRLYMAPGVGHCTGGVGADSTDLLNVMAKWVEDNAEPGSPGNPVNAWKRGAGSPDIEGAAFSRPLCQYPLYPHYIGRGDPSLAANHVCRPGLER
jgi:feruloyl esterase